MMGAALPVGKRHHSSFKKSAGCRIQGTWVRTVEYDGLPKPMHRVREFYVEMNAKI